MSNNRILLTGATGFIGNVILDSLLKNNYEIMVIARDPAKLKAANIKIIASSLEDIQNHEAAIIAFNPTAVINPAWAGTENTNRDNPEFALKNIQANKDLFAAVSKTSCKLWIGFGSQAEYSPDIFTDISEESPTKSDTSYGRTKLRVYLDLKAACAAKDINLVWLRVFASYGKNYKPSYVMPYIIDCFKKGQLPLIKNPHASWDYIHVNDIAAAVMVFLKTDGADGVFNISGGKTYSIAEIALRLAAIMGFAKTAELQQIFESNKAKPTRRAANITKIKSTLTWTPKITLNEGLKLSIEE